MDSCEKSLWIYVKSAFGYGKVSILGSTYAPLKMLCVRVRGMNVDGAQLVDRRDRRLRYEGFAPYNYSIKRSSAFKAGNVQWRAIF